jgi:hypothetical protein
LCCEVEALYSIGPATTAYHIKVGAVGSSQQNRAADVAFGSIALVRPDIGDFRSISVNGHSQDRRACLKGAKIGRVDPKALRQTFKGDAVA